MNLSNISGESDLLPQNLLTLFDEMSPHVICIADVLAGQHLFISKVAQKLFGYSHEDLCNAGVPFLNTFLHPDDKERVETTYAAKIEEANRSGPQPGKHFIYTEEFRLKQADKRWIWVESKTAIIAYTPEGKVYKTLCLVTDITEKKAEKNRLWNESAPVIKPHTQAVAQNREINRLVHTHTNRAADTWQPVTDNKSHIPVNISSREAEVLKLIAQGYSSKILAAELHISPHTADSHRKNLLAKFNVKNTAELVNEAYKGLWIR